MNLQIVKDSVAWGIVLWFIGYALGIIFFFVIPAGILGWVIMPIGITLTLFVLYKKIPEQSFQYYVVLAVVWTAIAILCDYFFLVKVFKPVDGYYKMDVYLYYIFTFMLPLLVGLRKKNM